VCVLMWEFRSRAGLTVQIFRNNFRSRAFVCVEISRSGSGVFEGTGFRWGFSLEVVEVNDGTNGGLFGHELWGIFWLKIKIYLNLIKFSRKKFKK
jgi:hypothetical protein